MAIADVAAIQKALKVIYPDKRVKFIGYENNPLLALLPKNEKFLGKQMDIPIWFGGNQGASRTFATAQSNKTAGLYQNFSLTRRSDYGLTSIGNEAILASASDEGAFLMMSKAEVDNTVRTVARNYAISLYQTFGGARGVVGSIAAGVLTLANRTQVVNFEKGQVIVQATTDGTSGSVGGATAQTILSVDRRLGTITSVSGNWTGFSATNFLFRQGDFGLSISGLASWIPQVTPVGGDNFFGCDRSVDTRLYGQFHDGSAQTFEEAIQDLEAKLYAEGGSPDTLMVNPIDFNTLRKNLGSNVVYDKVKSPDMASVSFGTIKLIGMGTEAIDVIADRNCPAGTGYLLQLDTWQACTLGGGPRILESMGMKFIWDSTSDSIEARIGYYGNLGCFAPGYNGVVKFY